MSVVSARFASWIGHHARVRGTDRVLRVVHSPQQSVGVEAIVRGNHGLRYHASTGSFIEWSLYMYGEYEIEVTDVLCSLLKEGDIAIDVGANIGVHGLPMALAVGPTGRVFAFEPLDDVRARLTANAQENGLTNVTIRSEALSDRNGTARFQPPTDDNRGAGRLDPSGTIDVRTQTVDSLDIGGARLIKIDTEGSDHLVVRGARAFIARYRPHLIYESFQHIPDRVPAEVEGLGYSFERLTDLVKIARP